MVAILKKRLISLVLFVVLIFSLSPILAESQISVIVNSKQVQFDVPPVIENGRTLVPLRAIFEALGAVVSWEPSTRTVTGVKGTKTIILTIDRTDATVNGIQKALDVPATIRNNRTLVPLRFISESLGSIVSWDGTSRTATINDAGLKVSFIDVGQADSILVETPNGKSLLIDAGNNEDGDFVVSYIKSKGLNKIDVIVGTHYHEDHIGGLDTVINNFDIGKIYMPNATTQVFEDVLIAAKNKNLKINTAKAGVNIDLDSDLEVSILAPVGNTYEDLNNYSAVIKLTYKNNSFLFEGDAGNISESEMLSSGSNLKADVLKVGHHGSNDSTTEPFLKAVSPKYAVISVGKDNDYWYPTKQTLDKLAATSVQVYRTDELGTIVAFSDGNTIAFDKTTSATTTSSKSTIVPTTTSIPTDLNQEANVVISDLDCYGETITITNNSASSIDLSGWQVISVKGNQTYYFPNGFTLKGKSSVMITSGPKAYSSGDSVLMWADSNIWNNDGDPAQLFNNLGKLVSSK